MQILNTDALGWREGQDAADFPELTWADYEPHLIDADTWLEKQDDVSDEALFTVISRVSTPEYDRMLDRLANQSGLAKRTLNVERKSRFDATTENESVDASLEAVDVSDIDLSDEEKQVRRAKLDPIVAALAHSENILDQVVQVCQETLGVHNEATLIKLGYLCIISRLLDGFNERPASLMLKGSSSSGKTHVIKQVLRLFRPDSTWIHLSSISPKGLIYDQRSYRGKVLFLPECNQLVDQDSLLTQLVKTILTEGSITHLTVDTGESRTPEGKVITKQGPIALIVGTIRDYLDAELETRMLSFYVDESPEQTRNIVLQAADRFAIPDTLDKAAIDDQLTLWLAFDEWLALSPSRKVVIPFYKKVVEPIAHMPVRYRRDLVEMVPALIKASALTHQANRAVIDGAIQAIPEDYDHVRTMVNGFLSRVQGDTATPTMLRVLALVYEQMPAEVREGKSSLTICQSELAKSLGISQQAVGYQLSKLQEKNYLINLQVTPKRSARLKLGPAFSLSVITDVDEILLSADVLGL